MCCTCAGAGYPHTAAGDKSTDASVATNTSNASKTPNTSNTSNTSNATAPRPTTFTSTSMGPPPPKPAPPAEDGCDAEGELPYIAPHSGGETAANIKVLSYNLYWWNLYDVHKGRDDSAAKLIASSHESKPFDLMGFQEC